jgi:hypothetical protein
MDDNVEEYDFDGDCAVECEPLSERRMLIIKVLQGGDIHAEDNDGQMIIVRDDGTVSSFLHGDTDWVQGELTVNGENYWEGTAWDVIGYHLGMTDGAQMERARGGSTQ